jgi:hypothetical protein
LSSAPSVRWNTGTDAWYIDSDIKCLPWNRTLSAGKLGAQRPGHKVARHGGAMLRMDATAGPP